MDAICSFNIKRKSFSIFNKSKKLFFSLYDDCFDTTELAQKEIGAAIHPRDKTARAQIVDKKMNPEYWQLINEFYKLTGSPCILNTSFNLHGYLSIEDLQSFINSGLLFSCIFIIKNN